LGVDTKRVIPMDSETVEEHFERVLVLLADLRAKVGLNVPIMIALDSLAMLSTQHEAETEITKRDLSKASIVRKCMRKLRIAMRHDVNTVYVVANHVIANIGDKWRPRTTPGGKSVPFQCSVRVELLLSNKVVEEGTKRVLGVETIAKVVKNKIIEPFRQCRLRIMYKTGIVPDFHLYEAAKAAGVCKPTKSEGWYRMDGVKNKFQQKTFYAKHADRALAMLEVKRSDRPEVAASKAVAKAVKDTAAAAKTNAAKAADSKSSS
jgi:RecA/RadA recombinase